MSQKLTLAIVTPKRIILEAEVEYATIPGEMGELGILPGHIPLLTNLKSGVLSYKNNSDQGKVAVHFGYAEVCQNKITILANAAELAKEIDPETAKSDQQKAESELAEALKDSGKIALTAELQEQIQIAISRQNAVL